MSWNLADHSISTNIDPVKSKTKCVIFSPRKIAAVSPIKLNSDYLPWVNEIKHLGNLLESNNSMKRDITVKRGRLIGKINSLSQEFFYVSPDTFMKILNIYTVSFHGSGLWDLFSSDCDRLYKAWNVAVRHAWNVPNTTHRYLIETISGCLHPKVMLASRYCGFVKSLLSSPKYPVRVLASLCSSDHRTVMGRSLSKVCQECDIGGADLGKLTSVTVKKMMKYFPVPDLESWRTGFLSELMSDDLEVPGFTEHEIGEMISFLCIS